VKPYRVGARTHASEETVDGLLEPRQLLQVSTGKHVFDGDRLWLVDWESAFLND
jgi:hypothetical protein